MGICVGLDIGTTGLKVVAYDSSKSSIEMDEGFHYEPKSLGPGRFEQDPKEVEDAVFNALRKVSERFKDIDAIVLDSALHTILFLDSDLKPITNIVPWLDERTVPQVERTLKDEALTSELHHRTGCPPATVYPFYKLLWFYDNEPEILKVALKIVSQKDYIVYKLTGYLLSDISVASGSACLDIRRKEWCYDVLWELVKVESDKFPELSNPLEVLALSKEASLRTGLPEGTPVILGFSDAAASSIGAGAGIEDSITVSVGSSAAIRAIVENPPSEYPAPGVWCYLLDEKLYLSGVAIKNGGYVFDWYVKLFSKRSYPEIINMVERDIEANLDNPVLFYPFIFGKRFPKFDPVPRARFDNLTSSTTEAQVARAVLEGIAFNLKRVFDTVKKIPRTLRKVVATGGLTQADIWMRMLSSIFEHEIVVQSQRQGAALGAILYFLSDGNLNSINLEAFSHELKRYSPSEPLLSYYKKAYERWLNRL
ncbi:MAG: gluconokinase [Synergistetes bacterium]|nr:gluconokinase [Synergistota bacterium]MDW8192861.1 gluconokinase [Synergistota bacterium]